MDDNKPIIKLPWIEKYRPNKLNDIISQKEIVHSLRIYFKNVSFPNLLFYGMSGCGKTSTIMACAKELYKDKYPYMVLELNASDDRGIDIVRNKITQFVLSKSLVSMNAIKLVILDEADAMTIDAQVILRKIIEVYIANARFCLICNNIQNITPALQSRCVKFRFSPLEKNDILSKY